MELSTSVERRTAEALVGTLEQMLAELVVGAARDGDVGWLRPLAVLSAEIEYSAVRSPEVDSINLADECRELSDLLDSSSRADAEFSSRYSEARGASPGTAALHDRALSACRIVAACHALVRLAA
jgi:hypothetical protein